MLTCISFRNIRSKHLVKMHLFTFLICYFSCIFCFIVEMVRLEVQPIDLSCDLLANKYKTNTLHSSVTTQEALQFVSIERSSIHSLFICIGQYASLVKHSVQKESSSFFSRINI